VKRVIIFLLKFYKKRISPFLLPACRFTPTCSEYAALAIEKYGILKGVWLSFKRILKCNPFNAGGEDPVP